MLYGGATFNHITYDSYGNVTSESNSAVDFRFGYTGREFDAETGQYYYRARYYDAGVGEFISSDPMGFVAGDINLYRYVGNSPLNTNDPTGLISVGSESGGLRGFGSAVGGLLDDATALARATGRWAAGATASTFATATALAVGIILLTPESTGIDDLSQISRVPPEGLDPNRQNKSRSVPPLDIPWHTGSPRSYDPPRLGGFDNSSRLWDYRPKGFPTHIDDGLIQHCFGVDSIGDLNIDDLINSSLRPARKEAEESRSLQALKKKIDRGDEAYKRLPKTQGTAEEVIREVVNAENPIVKTGTNRNGETYVDVYNPETGRGVRTINNEFDTFVNLNK